MQHETKLVDESVGCGVAVPDRRAGHQDGFIVGILHVETKHQSLIRQMHLSVYADRQVEQLPGE